ncbi:uncharacterized protein KIAA2012 homolog [Gastrophryne carolinensis]
MATLSLLSRGNAQIVKTSQERLEVHYEPEDYFNWRSRHDFHLRRFLTGKYASHNYWEMPAHKTYSTKKGPLVLYSEDLALPSWNVSHERRAHRSHYNKRKKYKLELSTLLDLTGAILSYGRKQSGHMDSHWQPYLHFLNEEDMHCDRQIRPGYSPKRYLTRLFQTWDPSTLYKLQQAGCLRDSVQLQQLTSYSGETSGRHPDLSSTPMKYQRLPVFLHLPQWTSADTYTSPGHGMPVEEEYGTKEKLSDNIEISELHSKKSSGVIFSCGTQRKSSPERTRSHATQGSWKPKEQYNPHMADEIQQSGDDTMSNRTQCYEKPPATLEVPFLKDNGLLAHGKPHTTFYGGPFTGRKKYPYGKQELMRLTSENTEHLPEGAFLPPISQTGGSEPEFVRDSKEHIKLPPIMEDSSRIPQRKRRRRGADPPKELLVIPLLVHFENQKATQGEKTAMEKSMKAGPMNNNEECIINNRLSQEEPVDPTMVKELAPGGVDSKVKTLQMDIEWNLDSNTDGDLPASDGLPLGLLPPLNGKKGPGNQSSMANLKAPNNNNSNTSSKAQGLPTGIIRGSIPEELKECCKGGSVGSLIMSPNGEIVCLSVMGAARESDIPIRFDFIPEEAEEDCLQEESAGQEEQWSGRQQVSGQEIDGPGPQTLQDFLNLPESPSSGPDHKEKKVNRKISVPVATMQEDADNAGSENRQIELSSPHRKSGKVSDQQIYIEKGHKKDPGEGSARSQEETAMQNDDRRVTGNAMKRVSSTEPWSTDPTNESMSSKDALSPENTVTKDDPQNAAEATEHPSARQQMSTESAGETTPKNRQENMSTQVTKNTDAIINEIPHNKPGETSRGPPLQELNSLNISPSSETLKTKEEKTQKSGPAAPSTVQNEMSNKQESSNKDSGSQDRTMQNAPNISKENSLKPDMKDSKIHYNKIFVLSNADEEESNGSKVNPRGLPLEAETLQQKSQPGKQMAGEEEEMATLQDIAKTSKSETTKGNRKKKIKPEKVQNTEKTQAKAAKKTKQGSATEGKAVFVVGPPKNKKTESKISHPKKPSGPAQSQQIIQVTQDVIDEIQEEEEEETKSEKSEKESEDSYKVTKHEERSPTPTESNNGIIDETQQTGQRDTSALVVTYQANDDDPAFSETSESTISSVRQRRPSRVRELSEKAERRRLEVERKRREREEQLRLEKEQQERMERMMADLEEEQRIWAEEIRLRKVQEEEERQRQEQEKARRMQLEQQAIERARQQQEEYRRKLQEIQRRKEQEELERMEAERQRKLEQERLEAEERMRLLEMAAEEREEYYRKKREREQQARQEEEQRRLKAEAEARAIMEEAQRQAQLLARRTAALEQQLQFNRGLMQESVGMDQTQGVSRPWVFSYFEFLELLGLPLPVEGE